MQQQPQMGTSTPAQQGQTPSTKPQQQQGSDTKAPQQGGTSFTDWASI